MTFILVTLSIMGVSIFLIYKLTNYFGFRMKYRSLILCAFMAFVVNVAAISMSPYLTQSHYIRLALLIIASAAVVTFYNERLVQRDIPAIAAGSEEVGEGASFAVSSETWESQASVRAPLEEPDMARAVPAHPVVDLNKTDKDMVSAAKENTTEKTEAMPKPAAKATEKNTPKPTLAGKATEKPLPHKPKKRPVHVDFSKFHSLDDILDFAYEKKSGNCWDEAIIAYKGALEKYSDDSYAPFIVIDLGNIYKEKAAYNDAIHTYKEALSLPIIANDVVMSGKFRENLSYLRTVQYILSKHNSLRTPFRDIPTAYLKEIEAEFQLRQKHS